MSLLPVKESQAIADISATPPTATPPAYSKLTPGEVEIEHPYSPYTTQSGGPQSKAQAKVQSFTDSRSFQRFPRISRPVELIRSSYDVVVIGSGYGGGVASSRMARGRQSVCLLERGKERWPGEYPTSLTSAAGEIRVSGDFVPSGAGAGRSLISGVEGGNPTGLYHLVMGDGQNAFMGNGLGGTSLLNANVFLRADKRTLAMNVWPPELRKEKSLEKYYERAEGVLQPEPYPAEFPELPKLTLLQKQAEALGLGDKFYRVPQTTRFVDGPNSTGVEMQASALTGMDCTGVNDGSKSSTLMNYLSDAWNWGAEMFCECEVRYIQKHPTEEGYLVFYTWYGDKRAAFKENIYEDLMWVHAKKAVFLGAGSIGSTEILLRSKELGLPMSERVGTGMSGNGDILAFGYNTDYNANALGRPFPLPERPIGPTINGVIDCRDQENPLDGFVIEEGAVPEALSSLLQIMLEAMPGKIDPSNFGLKERLRQLLSRQESRFLGPYYPKGSIERTQIYLIMSHDDNQAILTLNKDDKPSLKFLGVGRSEHVQKLNAMLAEATNAVGGTYINSPWYAALGKQEITVHPIGGANISSDGTGARGVTNHMGEVLKGNGKEAHENLVVVDGSVVPAALGVNPFATITAMAERAVEQIAAKNNIKIDYETKNGLLDLFGAPAHPILHEEDISAAEAIITTAKADQSKGIAFSEVMSGYIHPGDKIKDYKVATRIAEGACEAARFFLSVNAWDIDILTNSSDHWAMLTGVFTWPSIPGSPFLVHRGNFRLFSDDPDMPDTKNQIYDFDMIGIDGEKVHFHGYKLANPSVAFNPFDFWKSLATLYVTISRPDGILLGRGILKAQPNNFWKQITTLKGAGSSRFARIKAVANFLSFNLKETASLFLTPLSRLQWPSITYRGFSNPTPMTKTIHIVASDRIPTVMQMWEPETSDPTYNPINILLLPGVALDHQFYAMPTIKHNAVQYFKSAGYRVYCLTHRIGKTMVAENNWTTFDVRLDILAALKYIRETHGPKKTYIIAHCVGSMALASGLLDGTIPASWILGITASQVFMNPAFIGVNSLKSRLPIKLTTVYKLLVGSWFSCVSSTQDSLFQRLLNQILRLYPIGSSSELCNSVVCHRMSLAFGRQYTHRNLNAATHTQIARFIGGTSMVSLSHLVQSGKLGYVTTNAPLTQNLVTPTNIARLKGVPILLVVGAENVVFTPASTDVSYDVLRDALGSDDYERVVFEGRGHLDTWIGEGSYKDVYPIVEGHVERVIRRELGNGE